MKENLKDITTVQINPDLPKAERIKSFVEQIVNPYHFMCGSIEVVIKFADTDITLDERMENYLRSI